MEDVMEDLETVGFKPYYNWNTFNTYLFNILLKSTMAF